MHIDPVFHATAVTMRRDALHQTVLHAGRFVGRMDSANLASLNAEVKAWRVLRAARIEPVAINFALASNGRQHCRVSLKRGAPGQARLAIAALFSLPTVKHAFVVDEDVDVFSDQEMEWAMSTRFRADRDMVVATDMPGLLRRPDRRRARHHHQGRLRSDRAFRPAPNDRLSQSLGAEDRQGGGAIQERGRGARIKSDAFRPAPCHDGERGRT